MGTSRQERVIRGEVDIDASIEQVWEAWTTESGVRSFFAPDAHIELRVGGPYEIYFDPEAEPGSRGAEGVRILALQPKKMLSFTWNAPPQLPEVRGQWTHVVIRFQQLDSGKTRLSLFHDGWGDGGQWDQAFDYFQRAWLKIVLPRLRYRFQVGPVDWERPPKFISE